MRDEAAEIIKGIALVILICTIAIFFCLRLMDKNYIYKLKYYLDNNVYTLNITADYNIKIEVGYICKEDKCDGDKNNIISTSNGANKSDVKKLVEIFKLKPNVVLETNEDILTEEEKEIITKIIGWKYIVQMYVLTWRQNIFFFIMKMVVMMINYIKGIVTMLESNYIVIECNNIGYTVFVSNPYSYEINNEYTVYTYNHVKEDEYSLYGFKTLEERSLFLRLINVKGLGPKMAMPMFATGSVNGIVDAIDRENVLYLTKFPKIGDKLAKQIILDLKGKIKNEFEGSSNSTNTDELVEVLLSLGYKQADIKRILKDIDDSKSIEEQVKEALKLLLK